jgi:hypothetical protein
MIRLLISVNLGALLVASWACDRPRTMETAAPLAPAPPAVAAAVVELTIAGAPGGPMKARTFVGLSAKVRLSDGTITDCGRAGKTLSWQSSNTGSVMVASNGMLQVQDVPGEAVITARCGDVSSSISVTVGQTLSVEVWAHESDPVLPGGFGNAFALPVPAAIAEVLDGPDAGSTFRPDAAANPFLLVPVRLRFSAEGYAASERTIGVESGRVSGTTLRVDHAFAPLAPPPGSVERTGILTRGASVTHEIRADRAGVLDVRVWWSQEYSVTLALDLRCSSGFVRGWERRFESFGDGLTADVPAGWCSVSMSSRGGNPQQPYRLRLTVR